MRRLTAFRMLWVIWPAFVVAGIAEGIFFTLFDPLDPHLFGAPREMPREAFYTLGFFGFWALGVASSALTLFLNRPLLPPERGALNGAWAKEEEPGKPGVTTEKPVEASGRR